MARTIKWIASDYAYELVDELLADDGGLSRAPESALRSARSELVNMRDEAAAERKVSRWFELNSLEDYRDAIKLIDAELTRHRAFLKRQRDMFAGATP